VRTSHRRHNRLLSLKSPGMTSSRGLIDQPLGRVVSPDAVVVIPGIMGSTLKQNRRVLWGADGLDWYAKAWSSSHSSLDDLALSREERDGGYGRVKATGLLKTPSWAPFLRGIEPYRALVKTIKKVVAHPGAVLEFPYDWRLPVAYNAKSLEVAARAHLSWWQASDEFVALRKTLPDTRPAQLVLVAHSMGGLLVRALPDDLDVRATVTLGTPFDGAAKAVLILNTGRGAPISLPPRKMRHMAKTLPGLHDLLPTYRCLDDRVHDTDPQRLTPADVGALGGDPELAEVSFAWHRDTA
jgi:hypothetical protein